MLIYLIIIIALVAYIINLNNKNKTQKTGTTQSSIIEQENDISKDYFPYSKKMLLTKAEYSFYQLLKNECDKYNFLICPKVRMEDFINVTDKQNYMKYRGYIKSRHIDFLICNNKLHIIAGIELDDNTHKQEKIQKVDDLKTNIFKAISLPLFRIIMSDGAYKNQIETIMKVLTPKDPDLTQNDEIIKA